MKKANLVISAFVFAQLFCCCNPSSTQHNPEKELVSNALPIQTPAINPSSQRLEDQLHTILRNMNHNLSEVSLTGNANSDFSLLMLLHHFAGVQLCTTESDSGSNPEMRQIAESKITRLQQQIALYDRYQSSHQLAHSPDKHVKVPPVEHWNIPPTANSDVIFACILVEYDQCTIELARRYAAKCTNPALQKNAQGILENSKKEIEQLRPVIDRG